MITGANGGIGLATAKRFAAEGAWVFMTGRRKKELDASVAEVGHNSRGVEGDVASLADLDRLFQVVKDEAGAIDILFANAGLGEFAGLGEITENHFDRTFDVNVKGTLFTVQKALPLLKDGGSIILAGSTAASTGIPAFKVPPLGSVNPSPLGDWDATLPVCKMRSPAVTRSGTASIISCG